jgi:hypothetical protein
MTVTDQQHSVKPPGPYEWHPQQMKLLKKWAEIAAGYSWMHEKAYAQFKVKHRWYMMPISILSTITGTANFAQSSFPAAMQSYIAQLIGGVNLITAIMTGIYQFLKIAENMESYRVASISYGKLSRFISTELSIPIKDREVSGAECVKTTRAELDELISKSPSIPQKIKEMYIQEIQNQDLEEPENIKISPVLIYNDGESRITEVLKEYKKPVADVSSLTLTKTRVEKEIELEELKKSKLVSKSSELLGEILDSPRRFKKLFTREPKPKPHITYITDEMLRDFDEQQILEVPEIVVIPTEVPSVPEVPVEPEAPSAPEVPSAQEVPVEPGAPSAPEVPSAPEETSNVSSLISRFETP